MSMLSKGWMKAMSTATDQQMIAYENQIKLNLNTSINSELKLVE